jgi:osmotically inducible protein OsmC
VPGISEEEFRKAAEGAKAGCPISRLLQGGAEITLDAALLK